MNGRITMTALVVASVVAGCAADKNASAVNDTQAPTCGAGVDAGTGTGAVNDAQAPSLDPRSLDWLEGVWIGCEDEFLHEKAMTSSLGGTFLAATKILKDNVLDSREFLEIKPEADPENATMTFFTGTAVSTVVQCKMGDLSLECRKVDGSFAVKITFAKGSAADEDVLNFAKTYGGQTHILKMSRTGHGVPSCR